jgi:hypothetical protein
MSDNQNFVTSDWAEHNPTLLVPKIQASRYDDKSARFYFFNDPDTNEKRSAIGITTLLGKVMPESYFLTEWKLDYGDNWEEVLNLTAEYGTAMHVGCAHILINKTMPPAEYFASCKEIIKKLMKFTKGATPNMIEKNMISFMKFVSDYNVEPMLIEALLVYRTDEGEYYCMTQDLLCKVSYDKKWKEEVCVGEYVKGDKKGQPKYENQERSERVSEIWCVDFKSNYKMSTTKDFFPSHKLQLIGTKKAVIQNFGIKPDRLFNWSPLGWKTKEKLGAYALKEWDVTDKDYKLLDLYEKLAHVQGYFRPSGNIEKFNLETDNINEMYQNFEYLEYVKTLEEAV